MMCTLAGETVSPCVYRPSVFDCFLINKLDKSDFKSVDKEEDQTTAE